MPTVREHLAQCEHNQASLDHLLHADQFPDWVVTVCFYKAVHLIDAFLAANPGPLSHPNKHEARGQALSKAQKAGTLPRSVWIHYQSLWDLSLKARYQCVRLSPGDVQHARKSDLPQVEQWVMEHLKKKGLIGGRH
jgi:hypothetical protein